MTEFEQAILSELKGIKTEIADIKSEMTDMKSEMTDMKSEMADMKDRMTVIEGDISALKITALKVETELVPKTQLMLDSYMSLAEKVNISNDLQEEVKTLRIEVDLIKQAILNN